MPVTPKQAKRLYKEREALLSKIDEVILASYGNGNKIPGRIEVPISEEQYKNEILVEWLKDQYESAGWATSFDKQADTILFVLTEATK